MANTNNSRVKTFGAILTMVVLLIAAIIRPIRQRNDDLQRQIYDLKMELKDHAQLNNHPWGVVGEIAELREKFTEVETQFDGLRERGTLLTAKSEDRLDKLEKWQEWWYREIAINGKWKQP